VQYAEFVWRIVRHGSFGHAWTGGSIDQAIRSSIPTTLSILVGGAALLLLLAIPLGTISGVRAQTAIDRAILFFALFGVALHPFLLGLGLRKFFADYLHLTPPDGYCHFLPASPLVVPPGENPANYPQPCGGVLAWAHHLALPWLTFALFLLPLYTRMIRGRVLETLDAQHVVTARAKGASPVRVLRGHVLRPALLPVATMMGMDLGGAIMAAVYIEYVYRLPGMGGLMLNALGRSGASYDLPLIAALFFVIAAFAILLTLLVDLLYAWFDPRARLA
jgi:peptide/nickel transport system permease protein